MPVFLTCLCGRKLQVKNEFAGQDGRCPWCDRTLLIPPVEAVVPVEHITTDYQKRPPIETKPGAPKPSGGEHMGRIPHHTGDPLPGDADFFVDPPAEIGLLESAATTLRHGMQPRSPGARARLMLVLALVGLLVALIIVKILEIPADFWWRWMVGSLGLGVFRTANFNGASLRPPSRCRNAATTTESHFWRHTHCYGLLDATPRAGMIGSGWRRRVSCGRCLDRSVVAVEGVLLTLRSPLRPRVLRNRCNLNRS